MRVKCYLIVTKFDSKKICYNEHDCRDKHQDLVIFNIVHVTTFNKEMYLISTYAIREQH